MQVYERHNRRITRRLNLAGVGQQQVFLALPMMHFLQGHSVGTVFTFAVMGAWRPEFHTEDNLRKTKKMETTVTSVRAEVMVCVKKSKGRLVDASDSSHEKGIK